MTKIMAGDNIKNFLIFAVGVGVGIGVSWKLLRDKYEQIANEEIESVKEAFSERKKETEKQIVEVKTIVKEQEVNKDLVDYSKLATRYLNEPKKEEPEIVEEEAPYVISPDEYGEIYDYDQIELTYYADGVLTDDTDEVIDDVDDTVGLDSLNHFGDYEEDAVHVRNDERKCDYEILRDLRNYYGDIVEKQEE